MRHNTFSLSWTKNQDAPQIVQGRSGLYNQSFDYNSSSPILTAWWRRKIEETSTVQQIENFTPNDGSNPEEPQGQSVSETGLTNQAYRYEDHYDEED